jgi:ATP/maltotriose-dependent transcriptional regulator MalT
MADDRPLVPALTRALATWLERGSVLVMSASEGTRQAMWLATWLRTRAERIVWLEGSELRESGDAFEAALDGLYELGVLTRVERSVFTHLWDLSHAIRRENTPIVLVINDAQFLPELPDFPRFAELAIRWPNVRFAFVTDAVVDPSIGDADGVILLDAAHLGSPLGALNELSLGEPAARTQLVRDWALAGDASGGRYRLLLHMAGFLSVSRDSLELQTVNDLDGVLRDLQQRRVIDLFDGPNGQHVSLAPEFRDALDPGGHPNPETEAIHAEAARNAALAGDGAATIFHLARAGENTKALDAFVSIPLLALSSPATIEAARNAADAIHINDSAHSITALATRLQIATLPPLESVHARDRIQDALTRAQNQTTSPVNPKVQIELTLAHVGALIARGRFEEARRLGAPLAESLLALPWLERREFGIARILVWTAQATAEVLEGRIEDASRFARVAQEAALDADIPYALYMATAALAAIEARQGDLLAAERSLTEAQRLYRKWGWPRSVAQTVEFVARYYLARAALDVDGMIDLLLDISVVPDPSSSLDVLVKICECFVHLHSGLATQTRVAVRQLADLIRERRPGAILRAIGSEMTFEAFLRFGDVAAALELVETERREVPEAECVLPLLGVAHIALGDGATALSITEECAHLGSHHSQADHSLLLLMRAAAHELLDDTSLADEFFEEALLTQESSPMPYLFLMIPIEIRRALWVRISEERQQHWIVLRQFLGTVPEGVGRPDETLPQDRLTAREMEILRALSVGGTLEEIAVSQYVSRNTVKTHVRLIYRKLHVNTRAGAALVMKRFGEQLVETDDDELGSRARAVGWGI